MAAKVLEQIIQDEKAIIMYEQRQKWILDLKSSEEYARRRASFFPLR